MRVVAQIPHPKIRITIMQWNEKYMIEMEAGNYKQTFKISQDSVTGLEDVKSLCTDELIESAIDRFNAMHTDLTTAFKNTIK